MNRFVRIAFASLLAAQVGFVCLMTRTILADSPALVEPGGTAEDARLAAQEPDEYAWKLFLWINRQAKPGTAGEADPAHPNVATGDPDRDVVWETWALASRDGKREAEVFLAKGARPPAWTDLKRGGSAPKALDRNLTNLSHLLLQSAAVQGHQVGPSFVAQEPENDEVRMNRATFDFIRDQQLYNREGLATRFASAVSSERRDSIQFPTMAKEVKARWIPIAESDKPRFHWRKIGDKTYGLAAFHIITKDLPTWFWTDFIHTDLEANEPDPCSDATTRGPNAKHGTNGVREETEGTKWANYRLKGTQIAFTDQRGRPTILGNQLIESGNAKTSSCMTCHAGAAIGAGGARNVFGFTTGTPQSSAFGDGANITLLQTDFEYSLELRAHSTAEAPALASLADLNDQNTPNTIAPHIVEGFPNRLAAKLGQRKLHIVQASAQHGVALYSIIKTVSRWEPGTTLTVAFKGGTSTLHRQIADATKAWTDVANVIFDFGYNSATQQFRTWSQADLAPAAAIRISFDQNGYWSLVGKDCLDQTIVAPNEPTMNFKAFDVALPGDWSAVVVHEFGHALGLEHEHQAPDGECESEFRWDNDPGYVATTDSFGQFIADSNGRRPGLYTELGGPPNSWSADTVNFNLRALSDSHAFERTTFDAKSIMMYHFPDWMFKNGAVSSCYTAGENLVLSPLDRQGMQQFYPHSSTAVAVVKRAQSTSLFDLQNMNVFSKEQLGHLSNK